MVRAVIRWEVAYGQAKDGIAGIEAVKAACRDRGWAEWTAWAPISGKENDITLTCDYPDSRRMSPNETPASRTRTS